MWPKHLSQVQENLKLQPLPSDILELLQDSSIDLRIGYQAQHLEWEWLSLQRSFEEQTGQAPNRGRPTFSFLPVGYLNISSTSCITCS